jgi:L-aminopeptidase/D-esterase-like protein
VGSITDVAGILVGHDTDARATTGCTVVLCSPGTRGGVDVRGGAPGTRETDLLRPENTVDRVDAVMLSGGSAFGLGAAQGAMRFLQERGQGHPVGPLVVPIVVGAVIFDLLVGDAAWPGQDSGYDACTSATSDPPAQGSVGAGTGATVGKLRGAACSTKGGVGTASLRLGDGSTVGALMVVNAVGCVVDPASGRTIAGPRLDSGFADPADYLAFAAARQAAIGANTTIGVVATDASLDKAQLTRLAQMAHDGIALAVRPAHTPGDGDTIFALSTGRRTGEVDLTSLGVAAVQCVARAIVNAVEQATSRAGVPAIRDLR